MAGAAVGHPAPADSAASPLPRAAAPGLTADQCIRIAVASLKSARALGLLSAAELADADARLGGAHRWPLGGSLLASALLPALATALLVAAVVDRLRRGAFESADGERHCHPANECFLEEFHRLQLEHSSQGRVRSARQYGKVIRALKRYPLPITAAHQARWLDGVRQHASRGVNGVFFSGHIAEAPPFRSAEAQLSRKQPPKNEEQRRSAAI